jgi:hypothetical protein
MAFQAENLKGLAALTALLADMLEDRFVEAHAGAGMHLSLSPDSALPEPVPEAALTEPARQALATPASDTRRNDEPSNERPLGDERATEEWLEDELAASEAASGATPGSEFAGTRTGTHRRRGVAQSA